MKRAFVLGVCSALAWVACGLEAGEVPPGEAPAQVTQQSTVTTLPPIIYLPLADAGVDAGVDAGATCVVTSVPTLPTLPAAATKVANWPVGTPFIPVTVRSAYVSVYRHPTDKSQFVAYGFDVQSLQTFFYLTGVRATELTSFLSTIRTELSNLPNAQGNGGGGTAVFVQAEVPIPPKPTPGINDPDQLRANFVWTMSASTHKFTSEAQEYGQKNGW
ncbi:hypothetical protein KRR26_27620 [Corallococcus sp. M34]|uniref:hypothetical protein n=1 Tax=Citreicoccus inhibens TaxID=2849499 RepID=UPI001C2183C9|nr:hypothetical protein [Citreicoccus inhibens]MBU8899392.1 hypothetical protein [Citreicoccus inhibens]